jgi:BlaI family transcriptional regulator, penicillinase repressor
MRRTGSPREIPPPLELLCLNALWSLGEGNVRAVREMLAGDRALAYTTVMTVLERLVRRGLSTRRKSGRAFLYAPAISRDALRRLALQEFLDAWFESSASLLQRFLEGEAVHAPPQAPELTSQGIDPVLL